MPVLGHFRAKQAKARRMQYRCVPRHRIDAGPQALSTHGDTPNDPHAAPAPLAPRSPTKPQYDNFIGGKWVAPVKGQYFDVITPTTGKVYTQAARSTQKTSNWRWTPPTPPPTSGQDRRRRRAPTCC